MMVDFKNINCEKSLCPSSYSQKSQILPILGEMDNAFMWGGDAHFKTISQEKSRILQIFEETVAYLCKKSCILNKPASRKVHNLTVNLKFYRFFDERIMYFQLRNEQK